MIYNKNIRLINAKLLHYNKIIKPQILCATECLNLIKIGNQANANSRIKRKMFNQKFGQGNRGRLEKIEWENFQKSRRGYRHFE